MAGDVTSLPARYGWPSDRTVVSMSESGIGNVVQAEVAGELARLRAENARLLRLLKLTERQAAPPGPAQAGFLEAPPERLTPDRRRK